MRGMWHLTAGNQRGGIFLSGLAMVSVMTLLGVALFDLARIEGGLAIGDAAANQSVACAEAALARTMVDRAAGGRIDQINIAVSTAPGSTINFPAETLTLPMGTSCTSTVRFRDVANVQCVTGGGRCRYLTATAVGPGTATRTVQIQLNFLAAHFEFAMVANGLGVAGTPGNGDVYLGGTGPAGLGPPQAPPSLGPGGDDVINGDLFVSGRVLIGNPATSCAGLGCEQRPAVNPRSTTDIRTTVTLPTGSTWTQDQAGNSGAWPGSDPNPWGYRPDMPKPDVDRYVREVKASVGITPVNPTGNMTGTYQGSPVLNLSAAFAAMSANDDGSLRRPNGAPCSAYGTNSDGPANATNATVYCQLRHLGVMKNPDNRAAENADTVGDDFYFDGTRPGGELIAGKSGEQGAQRRIDLTQVAGQPPIILADGAARFHHAFDGQPGDYGFAIIGRGTFVATNDLVLADNLIYQNGLDTTDPRTADMIGLVAQRDIWYGDPRYGTFYEGSGIMLAGRDFNFVFFDITNHAVPKTPGNHITLNGTMLANRQIAVFRDFANPNNGPRPDLCSGCTDADATCGPGTTSCQAVQFDLGSATFNPLEACGSASGCWRFITRDANGNITFDTTKPAFMECGQATARCGAATRKLSHYQMTLNYDNRLFTASTLVPPGMPTGAGAIFGNSWREWQQCPPCN